MHIRVPLASVYANVHIFVRLICTKHVHKSVGVTSYKYVYKIEPTHLVRRQRGAGSQPALLSTVAENRARERREPRARDTCRGGCVVPQRCVKFAGIDGIREGKSLGVVSTHTPPTSAGLRLAVGRALAEPNPAQPSTAEPSAANTTNFSIPARKLHQGAKSQG